jgi:hypothetical protein
MEPTIEVKIKGDQAIVRKTLHSPPRRYALTSSGQWTLVPEGQAYPKQCILPVIKYDNSPGTNT